MPTPHLDGHHVVFGRVVSGMDVVTAVETGHTEPGDRPTEATVIAACGLVGGGGSGGGGSGGGGGVRRAGKDEEWESRVYG